MSNDYDPKEAREIFASACDLDPAQQESFVRKACNNRETLFDEVMSLLRYDAITDSSDGLSSTEFQLESVPEVHPEKIDRYEIDTMIGASSIRV